MAAMPQDPGAKKLEGAGVHIEPDEARELGAAQLDAAGAVRGVGDPPEGWKPPNGYHRYQVPGLLSARR
jgi:hypothetical protein